MDVFQNLPVVTVQPLSCIDMHTCGEPTRIVVGGYPQLNGTLLEQRAQAKAQYDYIRRRLILEPRGHFDMYGAILRQGTEHTRDETADIGVLFATNDGYSTMCGHATIALGRFLVDTHDLKVFPRRNMLKFDSQSKTVQLRLHCPCGVVLVTVPTNEDGSKSDVSRNVSFISVDSFATGLSIEVPIPQKDRWPELGDRQSVVANFAYGGAFYCLLPAVELGFSDGLKGFEMDAMNQATKKLKRAVNENKSLKYLFQHPAFDDLSFLYSVIVADTALGPVVEPSIGAETGLCFFSDQEIDRSPTGSGVSARLAAAYAGGHLKVGEHWTYHSLVSLHGSGAGAFVGAVHSVSESNNQGFPIVRTLVQGKAFYTGTHTFVLEAEDSLGDGGFLMQDLAKA